MNRAMLATALSIAFSNQSLAAESATVDPAADTVPAPAAGATDWSGAYAGLTFGGGHGWTTDSFAKYDITDGTMTGLFVGYNFQLGALVLGAELAHARGTGLMIADAGEDDIIDTVQDLRMRFGHVVGKALIYGSAGRTNVEMTMNGVSGNDLSGTSLGVGVDYMLNERWFAGLEYTRRSLDEDHPFPFDLNLDMLSLRTGLQF